MNTLAPTGFALTLLVFAGCDDSRSSAPAGPPPPDAPAAGMGDDAPPTPAFQSVPASVYVAKVKNLLVGLPPTTQEVRAVQADATALETLIDAWLALPQYRAKMLGFFELAFQQTQISIEDFADQSYPRPLVINPSTKAQLARNAEESFARTVLALIDEGRPFSEAITTRRFMLTPALMELYAFLDAWQVDNAGTVSDRFKQEHKQLQITVGASQGPIPIEQTLDPKSPNYMHWYDPDVGGQGGRQADCDQDPITYPARGDVLHGLLYGSLLNRKNAAGQACGQFAGTAQAPQLTASDFDTWKMVTIRPPGEDESRTAFYDLPALRANNELLLTTPRVGFFTTPAFFANWPTNISNQMRVTINQALIVAIGAAVDGSDPTVPAETPGLDPGHSSPAECAFCHRTLDPTRSILAATYSWNYHDQNEAAFAAEKGLFAFQGVIAEVADVAELASTLANHPRFAEAWVQKLCFYANSQACSGDDPEFARVVAAFRDSGFSWNVLVKTLFASPLTTYAASTRTTQQSGGVVAVARRDHICAALDARFGFDDLCGLRSAANTKRTGMIPKIVAGLPSDGYGRGAIEPVLPNQPSLFYRAGMENLCEMVARQVIDVPAKRVVPGVATWSSADPTSAIAEFAQTVMGLTASDPRSELVIGALTAHFTAARQAKASPAVALQSTFVVACLSPSSLAIGM